MSGNLPFRRAALWATLLACLCHAPATVGQQTGAPNPHAGLWTLEFRVRTRAGGQTAVASRGFTPEDVQTINVLVHVTRPRFRIEKEGVLKFEQMEGGQVHWDDFSSLLGKTATSDTQPILKVNGQATAVPAPATSTYSYDRRIKLELDWAGGSGVLLDHRGVPWPVAGSPDAVTYEHSSWDLQGVARRETLGPDMFRETTIFRGTRQRASTVYKIGVPPAPLQITEEIVIKHVFYPRLVPRG